MDGIGAYLLDTTDKYPEWPAIVHADRSLSYQQLTHATLRLAEELIALGLRPQDRVLILIENSPEAVAGIFAASLANCVHVCVHPQTRWDRLLKILLNAEPRVVLVPESAPREFESTVKSAIPLPPAVKTVSIDALLRRWGGRELPSPLGVVQGNPSEEAAAIIYTSGSLGEPKGVVHSFRSLDSVMRTVDDYLEHDHYDRILCVLQLSSSYGLLQLLSAVRAGSTLVLEPGFGFPYDVVKKLKKYRITGFAGVPTLWAMLLQLPEFRHSGSGSLRYITNAAAALPEPLVYRLHSVLAATKMFLMHGMTECLRTTYLPPDQIEKRPTSVGKGMKGVSLFLVDGAGDLLGPGSTGELVVQGENIMRGYWRDPDATARVFLSLPDGAGEALRSGDLFQTDKEGYLYFVGRSDDIVKVKGDKVSPLEVENVLYMHEGVQECRAFGVPDDLLGQVLVAEVVLSRGARTISERTLKELCRRYLESHKIPRRIAFVAALPKTSGGKIIRRNGEWTRV